MKLNGHIELFRENGEVLTPNGIDHRPLEIQVRSDAYGKALLIGDSVTGVQFTVNADLIAYWLEHGTTG